MDHSRRVRAFSRNPSLDSSHVESGRLAVDFFLSQASALADARQDQDIEVNVQTNGKEVSVDVGPGVWIPPVVGKAFVEHETREQFREMRDEIIKRKSTPR